MVNYLWSCTLARAMFSAFPHALLALTLYCTCTCFSGMKEAAQTAIDFDVLRSRPVTRRYRAPMAADGTALRLLGFTSRVLTSARACMVAVLCGTPSGVPFETRAEKHLNG
jgi:hypothetical protein